MDPFTPIIGGKNIASYMKYNYNHMSRDIIPEMKSYGLMWKKGDNLQSPLVTTPLLINIYFILRNATRTDRNKITQNDSNKITQQEE